MNSKDIYSIPIPNKHSYPLVLKNKHHQGISNQYSKDIIHTYYVCNVYYIQ